MDRPTCGTCPFWDKLNYPAPDGSFGWEAGYHPGICRRSPAVFVGVPAPGEECNHFAPEEWSQPWTQEKDWCGEHPRFFPYLKASRVEEQAR